MLFIVVFYNIDSCSCKLLFLISNFYITWKYWSYLFITQRSNQNRKLEFNFVVLMKCAKTIWIEIVYFYYSISMIKLWWTCTKTDLTNGLARNRLLWKENNINRCAFFKNDPKFLFLLLLNPDWNNQNVIFSKKLLQT